MTSRAMRFAPLLLPFLLLASCGPNGNDPGPGGVTVAEAQALDEAAEMIEQQRLPAGALEGRAEPAAPSAMPAAPAAASSASPAAPVSAESPAS